MSKYDQNEAPDSLDELWRRDGVAYDQIKVVKRLTKVGPWINPTYQNGWGNATGKQKFQYRIGRNGKLETRGVLDGGNDNTVAFTLPQPWRPQSDEIIEVFIAGGIASGFVNATTGEVTIATGLGSIIGEWIVPTLLNSWESVFTDPDCVFAYRWGPHNSGDDITIAGIELRGRINGGTSGTVAWIFPVEDRFPCLKEYPIGMKIGGTPAVGWLEIDETNGEATITYPI